MDQEPPLDSRGLAGLRCPVSGLPLEPAASDALRAALGERAPLYPRENRTPPPVGATPTVLLRSDGLISYPVWEGIPVLLAPERLTPRPETSADTTEPPYAEPYAEMAFYNAAADRDDAPEMAQFAEALRRIAEETGGGQTRFPEPRALWVDAPYDSLAQDDAYRHLAPMEGADVLQLGGKASHALKFLLAGARSATVVSPMPGEALFSRRFAERFGMQTRLRPLVAIAEELPCADASFDAVYSGGCVHHMVTNRAFREIARVLRPGGRFAAVEPWRAPLYRAGIRIFGKREEEVRCRPLDAERVAPFRTVFPEGRILQHGALTRYPLLALMKLGWALSEPSVWRIVRADDAVTSRIPGLRRMREPPALTRSAG